MTHSNTHIQRPHPDSAQGVVFEAVNTWLGQHHDVPNNAWSVHEREAANGRYIHWRTAIPANRADHLDTQIRLYLHEATINFSGMRLKVAYRPRRTEPNQQRDRHPLATRVIRVLDDLYDGKIVVDVVYAGSRPIIWKLARQGSRGWRRVGKQKACLYNPLLRQSQKRLTLSKIE